MKSKALNTDTSRQEITSSIQGFPLTCYFSRFSDETYDYIDWHWHVEFQLCAVMSGSVLWQVGPDRVTVDKGEGIFINSQHIHRAQPYKCSEASFFCVDFRPDLIKDREINREINGSENDGLYKKYVLPVLGEAGIEAKKISPQYKAGEDILQRLKHMAEAFENKDECYEYELVGNIYSIWGKLFPAISNEAKHNDAHDTRLKEIFVYIQSTYAQPITLDDIAANTGVSRSECCRYFKSQTGQTLFEYLIQYRIRKSLDMLAAGSKSISQVAQDVGFSSQSYYTERFRRIMGMTPTEYKRTLT